MAVPEFAAKNGVKYETLSVEAAVAMSDFLADLRGQSSKPLIPAEAKIAISTGNFPSLSGNGHLDDSSLPLPELQKILKGCSFGPIQSLGDQGGKAFGMAVFTCPNSEYPWKNGAIGFAVEGGKIDFVVNNGDLPNLVYNSGRAGN